MNEHDHNAAAQPPQRITGEYPAAPVEAAEESVWGASAYQDDLPDGLPSNALEIDETFDLAQVEDVAPIEVDEPQPVAIPHGVYPPLPHVPTPIPVGQDEGTFPAVPAPVYSTVDEDVFPGYVDANPATEEIPVIADDEYESDEYVADATDQFPAVEDEMVYDSVSVEPTDAEAVADEFTAPEAAAAAPVETPRRRARHSVEAGGIPASSFFDRTDDEDEEEDRKTGRGRLIAGALGWLVLLLGASATGVYGFKRATTTVLVGPLTEQMACYAGAALLAVLAFVSLWVGLSGGASEDSDEDEAPIEDLDERLAEGAAEESTDSAVSDEPFHQEPAYIDEALPAEPVEEWHEDEIVDYTEHTAVEATDALDPTGDQATAALEVEDRETAALHAFVETLTEELYTLREAMATSITWEEAEALRGQIASLTAEVETLRAADDTATVISTVDEAEMEALRARVTALTAEVAALTLQAEAAHRSADATSESTAEEMMQALTAASEALLAQQESTAAAQAEATRLQAVLDEVAAGHGDLAQALRREAAEKVGRAAQDRMAAQEAEYTAERASLLDQIEAAEQRAQAAEAALDVAAAAERDRLAVVMTAMRQSLLADSDGQRAADIEEFTSRLLAALDRLAPESAASRPRTPALPPRDTVDALPVEPEFVSEPPVAAAVTEVSEPVFEEPVIDEPVAAPPVAPVAAPVAPFTVAPVIGAVVPVLADEDDSDTDVEMDDDSEAEPRKRGLFRRR